MAILEILTYPNPELKKVSSTVESIDDQTRAFIDDLLETLYASPGCVGIAAPQTGKLLRIIAIDASRNTRFPSKHGKQILINPHLVASDGEVMGREGCLSLPDFTANVKRAKTIQVEAIGADGQRLSLDAEDFEARVILHEIDHLDGILFLDRVSSLKTDVFRRKRFAQPESGKQSEAGKQADPI